MLWYHPISNLSLAERWLYAGSYVRSGRSGPDVIHLIRPTSDRRLRQLDVGLTSATIYCHHSPNVMSVVYLMHSQCQVGVEPLSGQHLAITMPTLYQHLLIPDGCHHGTGMSCQPSFCQWLIVVSCHFALGPAGSTTVMRMQ